MAVEVDELLHQDTASGWGDVLFALGRLPGWMSASFSDDAVLSSNSNTAAHAIASRLSAQVRSSLPSRDRIIVAMASVPEVAACAAICIVRHSQASQVLCMLRYPNPGPLAILAPQQ